MFYMPFNIKLATMLKVDFIVFIQITLQSYGVLR